MGAMVSQIIGISIVYSFVCSGADKKKPSKLRVIGLCEGHSPVTGEFPHKGPVTRKISQFDDVIMIFPQTCSRRCSRIIPMSYLTIIPYHIFRSYRLLFVHNSATDRNVFYRECDTEATITSPRLSSKIHGWCSPVNYLIRKLFRISFSIFNAITLTINPSLIEREYIL